MSSSFARLEVLPSYLGVMKIWTKFGSLSSKFNSCGSYAVQLFLSLGQMIKVN